MDFFTMTRKGTLHPSKRTSNQCKQPEHSEYFYVVNIVFRGDVPLDKNKFIVKHEELDAAIRNSFTNGSCEEMHLIIRQKIRAFFKAKKLTSYIVAFKCTIYPTLSDITDGAFISCVHIMKGAPKEVGLLL
jgi:hypothetical protein